MSAAVLCVGGGVIGLMTAWRLAQAGLRVVLLDAGPMGRQSSWAGAGILSPAVPERARTALDQLHAFSFAQYPTLAEELQADTGIDIEVIRAGALELAATPAEAQSLANQEAHWQNLGIEFERLTPAAVTENYPAWQTPASGAYWFPQFAQVRTTRLLAALQHAAAHAGVELRDHCAVVRWHTAGPRVLAAITADQNQWTADHIVVSAGCWSGALLGSLGVTVPVYPVRGQMLAYRRTPALPTTLVQQGRWYFVPRRDGLLLVGATEEPEAGFDTLVSAEGAKRLQQFAWQWLPELRQQVPIMQWSGLRPGCSLGSPVIGRVADWDNLWLATGHYRQGIQWAPGTAKLLTDAILGRSSFVPVDSFTLNADRTAFQTHFHS